MSIGLSRSHQMGKENWNPVCSQSRMLEIKTPQERCPELRSECGHQGAPTSACGDRAFFFRNSAFGGKKGAGSRSLKHDTRCCGIRKFVLVSQAGVYSSIRIKVSRDGFPWGSVTSGSKAQG